VGFPTWVNKQVAENTVHWKAIWWINQSVHGLIIDLAKSKSIFTLLKRSSIPIIDPCITSIFLPLSSLSLFSTSLYVSVSILLSVSVLCICLSIYRCLSLSHCLSLYVCHTLALSVSISLSVSVLVSVSVSRSTTLSISKYKFTNFKCPLGCECHN